MESKRLVVAGLTLLLIAGCADESEKMVDRPSASKLYQLTLPDKYLDGYQSDVYEQLVSRISGGIELTAVDYLSYYGDPLNGPIVYGLTHTAPEGVTIELLHQKIKEVIGEISTSDEYFSEVQEGYYFDFEMPVLNGESIYEYCRYVLAEDSMISLCAAGPTKEEEYRSIIESFTLVP